MTEETAAEELRDRYRRSMARLPAGLSVVTLRHGSADLAMTASSLVSVSLDPPTVLFCVHADARFREVLDEVSDWAVSVLDATGAAVAERCAEPGRPMLGQLVGIGHRRGEHSGAAVLDGAQAWLECRTTWIRSAGAHDIVVGEVVDAGCAATATGALLHYLGRMRPIQA